MRKVRKVIITGRRKAGRAVEVAKKVIRKLKKWKIHFEVTDYFPAQEGGVNLNSAGADMVLAFGGDGTLLRTFQRLKKSIPVLGVNCGNKGFLMGVDETNVIKKLPKILRGNFLLEKRMRLKIFVDGKEVVQGLNEVAIIPQFAGRLLKYRLRVDETLVGKEAGDGLIVATPTGSTAHAFSAGGPKILGNAKVFAIVRMNPIDLNRKALIVNDVSKIIIGNFQKPPVQVIVDGQQDFLAEKEVIIMKGKNVLMVKLKE